MVVELGPSAINSEAKPAEENETAEAEKDDEVGKEDGDGQADIVVDDYVEQEDNGERFLDDHLTKIRNSKTVSYTPQRENDLMSAVTY